MTTPQVPLAHVRAELDQTFGLRRDAIHDLLNAVLTSDRLSSLVRLSLNPAFRRQWSSLFDTLTDGTLDLRPAARVRVGRHAIPCSGGARPRPHPRANVLPTGFHSRTP